jgi:hypothetical protein
MDVQYIVDSAAELGEITPLECAALYLLDPAYRRVDMLVANKELMPEDFLQNTARLALSRATPDHRHWVALNGLRSVESLARCMQERAEYLVQKKIQSDLQVTGPYRLVDGMAENSLTFTSDKMVETEAEVSETVVRAILNRHMGGFLARLKKDDERVTEAILWYQNDGGARFRQLQLSHNSTMHNRESLGEAAYAQARQAQKKRLLLENKRPVRGAIKKICKLFAQFKQEDNLRLFVSGSEVELSHPDSTFKFVLRPLGEPGWLEDRSAKGQAHTPYDLAILTKDDVFIAKLCVYFTDTPVLDQLLALALFVQSGDELRVLETANFFGFSESRGTKAKETLLAAYPSLGMKFPQPRVTPADADLELELMPAQGKMRLSMAVPFQVERAHWEPFKGRVEAWVNTWFEPVMSQLLPKVEMLRLAP